MLTNTNNVLPPVIHAKLTEPINKENSEYHVNMVPLMVAGFVLVFFTFLVGIIFTLPGQKELD